MTFFKKKVAFDIPKNFDEFIGKTLTLKDGRKVVVESIVGNRITPKNFEVNGEHLISMLRAYKQLYSDDSITDDQLEAFEEIETYVEKIPDKKSVLEVQGMKQIFEVIHGQK